MAGARAGDHPRGRVHDPLDASAPRGSRSRSGCRSRAGWRARARPATQMTARWHLGPISGTAFLVGARHLARGPRLPLLHDHRPKTAPRAARARRRLRRVDRPPRCAADRADRTEYWTKVGMLGALAIVCLARALLPSARSRLPSRRARRPRGGRGRCLRRRSGRGEPGRRARRSPARRRRAAAARLRFCRRAACRPAARPHGRAARSRAIVVATRAHPEPASECDPGSSRAGTGSADRRRPARRHDVPPRAQDGRLDPGHEAEHATRRRADRAPH